MLDLWFVASVSHEHITMNYLGQNAIAFSDTVLTNTLTNYMSPYE